MAKDAYHCEGHASKVTESVSNKNSRWELVVLDKSKSHHNKWNDDCQREDVLGDYLWRSRKVDFLHQN